MAGLDCWHADLVDRVAVGDDANGYVNQLISRTTSNNIGLADKVTVFNGTSLTATLPDPTTGAGSARITTIKNVNASALTVASAGTSKTIDGASSASLAQWAVGRYVSDGTQWLSV
jgi:phage tail protein X